MDMVIKAIQFASEKHKGQFRRGSGLPYVTHPIIVAYLLAKFKTSKNLEELMTAAILHDTLEDTNTSYNELVTNFNKAIAGLVFELTSCPDEIERHGKKEYMKKKMLGMSSYALTLKLVDRLSNIMDHPTEKMKSDTHEIMIFLEDQGKFNITQFKIVQEIRKYL